MPPHDARSPTSRPPLHLHAGSTAALFTWAGDRWTHQITTQKAEAAADRCSIWCSIEGAWPSGNDPRWPASPVLVELQSVAVPGSGERGHEAIVGVGLAGRSHFSASITPDPREADALRFEIACRLHEPPVWLGSTYRRGQRLVRLTAAANVAALPTTVIWAYSIGHAGIFSVCGAAVSEHDL
jgi:hypothetical protein